MSIHIINTARDDNRSHNRWFLRTQGRLSGAAEHVLRLDELVAGYIGERTLRATVARLRALRTARSFRGTRGTSVIVVATTVRPPDGPTASHGGELTGSDRPVQAEPMYTGLGVLGQQGMQDRPRVQAVSVRARVQGG